jgi:hypothetical protein
VQGGGLTSHTSASTTFAVGPAGAAPLIYASAATVAATGETATARLIVFGDFLGGSFAAVLLEWGEKNKNRRFSADFVVMLSRVPTNTSAAISSFARVKFNAVRTVTFSPPQGADGQTQTGFAFPLP